MGISNVYFMLEGFSNVYFTLFSPRSGLCTIREKAGISSLVLVRFRAIRSLLRQPCIVSFLFPKMRDVRTYLRTEKKSDF